jgi:oligopeptidase B
VGTNERGINSEIIQIPVELLEQQQQQQQQQQAEQNNFEMKDDRRLGQWRVVLPHDNSIQRINLTCFHNYIIVYEQSQCKKQIRVVELNPLYQFSGGSNENVDSIHKSLTFDHNFHYISLPEEVYTLAPGNIDDNYTYVYREKAYCPYQNDTFVFSYTSFITPKTIVEYDMRTRAQRIQWQQKIQGYNPNEYLSERVFVPSFDGVLIPISLVWRKDLRVEGKPSPLVMYFVLSFYIYIQF